MILLQRQAHGLPYSTPFYNAQNQMSSHAQIRLHGRGIENITQMCPHAHCILGLQIRSSEIEYYSIKKKKLLHELVDYTLAFCYFIIIYVYLNIFYAHIQPVLVLLTFY